MVVVFHMVVLLDTMVVAHTAVLLVNREEEHSDTRVVVLVRIALVMEQNTMEEDLHIVVDEGN